MTQSRITACHAARARRTALFLAALALTACSSNQVITIDSGEGTLLAEQRSASGYVTYRIHPGDSKPAINRLETRSVRKSVLGVQAHTIDSRLALKLRVPAGRGVWLQQVDPVSPAAAGGLLSDDILISIGGTEIVSREQLQELLTQHFPPGQAVTVEVLRADPTQDGQRTDLRRLSVVPAPADETVTTTDSFQLEPLRRVQGVTGMQLVEVNADLAKDIFGVARPQVLVSGVVSGSPAYLAGVRTGDRVLACDGVAIEAADAMVNAVNTRLGLAPAQGAAAGAPLALQVEGPLGPHEAEVEVVEDLDESTHFQFPILFRWNSDTTSTRWAFLDFIFQFGATYRSQYVRSTDRDPAAQTRLSLLPFGMFEFESSPTQSSQRYFWFICWTSRS